MSVRSHALARLSTSPRSPSRSTGGTRCTMRASASWACDALACVTANMPPSSFGGDDVATIPASHADLLKKPAFANLATVNADGSPQVTPVWVDFDGTHVIVNTARGRVKAKNLAREPRVALSIADPENPSRYLGIQR